MILGVTFNFACSAAQLNLLLPHTEITGANSALVFECFVPHIVPLQHFCPRPVELYHSSQGHIQCTQVHSLEVCSSSLPVQRQGDRETLGSAQPICCCLAGCWNSTVQKASHGISHAFSVPGVLTVLGWGKHPYRQQDIRRAQPECSSKDMTCSPWTAQARICQHRSGQISFVLNLFCKCCFEYATNKWPFSGFSPVPGTHPVLQAGHEWRVTWKALAPWIATAQIPCVRSSVTYVPFVPNGTRSYFSSDERLQA